MTLREKVEALVNEMDDVGMWTPQLGPGETARVVDTVESYWVHRFRELLASETAGGEAPVVREALQWTFDTLNRLAFGACEHEVVCADKHCRAAAHEHEVTSDGEGWACEHGCTCLPACRGYGSELCPKAAEVQDVLTKAEEALCASAPSPAPAQAEPRVALGVCEHGGHHHLGPHMESPACIHWGHHGW